MTSGFTSSLTGAFLAGLCALAVVGCSNSGSLHNLPLETLQTRPPAGATIVAQADPEEENPVTFQEGSREAEIQSARYQARRIGQLMGQTPHQNSFTDFPYDALAYDLLSPASNWITDDNADPDDSFVPFDSTSIDRGDGWTEHNMKRTRAAAGTAPDAEAEAAQAAKEAVAGSGADATMDSTENSGTGSSEGSGQQPSQEETDGDMISSDDTGSVVEYIIAYSDAVSVRELASRDAESDGTMVETEEPLSEAAAAAQAAAEAASVAHAAAAVAALAAEDAAALAAENPFDAAAQEAAAAAALEAVDAAAAAAAAQEYADVAAARAAAEAAAAAAAADDPWVNFGWWLEIPEDAEGLGYRFATFVDGGNRYGSAELANVDPGTASYEGPAAGVYVKRERTTLNTRWGRFNAKVSLTARFYGADHSDGLVAALEGQITDFVDGDDELALDNWSVTLEAPYFTRSSAGEAPHFSHKYGVEGEAAGHSLSGSWQANFYEGSEWHKGADMSNVPGTVAGQFRAFSHSETNDVSYSDPSFTQEPVVTSSSSRHFDDEGFLGLTGAFGAHLNRYYSTGPAAASAD